MKKYLIGFLVLLLTVSLALAIKPPFNPGEDPDTTKVLATNGMSGVGVAIPMRAVEMADHVFYLGTAIDGDGTPVEGYAIIDYKKGYGKPGTSCGNGVCEIGENAKKCPADCGGTAPDPVSTCYGFLSKGAKWKVVENYLVDSSNNAGLSSLSISSSVAGAIAEWEDAADGTLDDGGSVDILGNEAAGIVDRESILGLDDVYNQNDGTLNLKNELLFAPIYDPNIIGVTLVWGIWTGKPSSRELREWDQVYNTDFRWSEDCLLESCTTEMDFPNIAIHELGHSVGLDDLYTAECAEETMYGYAADAETKKRTLEAGDIAGVSELY